MTSFGAADARPVSLRGVAAYLVGIAGLTFSLTIIWLTMRAVMGIGGACASGGPYVPAVECPESVVLLMPVSMFGLFIFGGLAAFGGAALGGSWIGLIALGWPALFLSLGWNFLEFGVRPPGGEPGEVVWSWLFCGIVFLLMGGVPLAIGLWGMRQASGSQRAYAGGRVVIQRRPNVLSSGASSEGLDVAGRLERLSRLRRSGDLTDAEFEAAKRATLDEAGA